jgi:hypothetical protein
VLLDGHRELYIARDGPEHKRLLLEGRIVEIDPPEAAAPALPAGSRRRTTRQRGS